MIALKSLAQYAWMSDSPRDRARYAAALEQAIKGMPKPDIGHGDLLVHVRVMLPDQRDIQLETFLGGEISSTGFF